MHDSVCDFMGTALIPELCSDVTAGSSCDMQFVFIGTSAFGTNPYQFSVLVGQFDFAAEPAISAVIGFGIEFGI